MIVTFDGQLVTLKYNTDNLTIEDTLEGNYRAVAFYDGKFYLVKDTHIYRVHQDGVLINTPP